MAGDYKLDLPSLPTKSKMQQPIISENQFSRRKLQGLLHIMTAELKARGTKTPHIFLPFRSRVEDTKLNLFLRRVFPGGELVDTSNKAIVRSLLEDFDEFTLICGLKYLWCRLPNSEIIGWDVYLEFKRKEKEAGFPKDAFLTIMPKCLSSSSHASIVYDFLDLLISVASNSQYNHLNGRKISKMASLWAFKSSPESSSAFYDATHLKENSFLEGLDLWKQTCNGLFHLLLSFLRAMLPDTEAETLNLPKTLQSLLITNTYPPPESNNSVKSVITIPCVHIRSTRKSSNPYELLSKVRNTLSFNKKDSFLSIENYTILKNIFQKPSTAEIVSTLTEESRRVLARLTAEPVPSDFNLYPGWVHTSSSEQDPNIPLYSEITISNVTLQDYFIWTWLSSLGSDQNATTKLLFGRSLVVEAGLKGFQKWMVLTETTMSPDEYLSIFKRADLSPSKNHNHNARLSPAPKNPIYMSPQFKPTLPPTPVKDELPPPPVPAKPVQSYNSNDPSLPEVDFAGEQFALEDHNFMLGSISNSQQKSADAERAFAQAFQDNVQISSRKKPSRPRPPPLHSNSNSPQKSYIEPVDYSSEYDRQRASPDQSRPHNYGSTAPDVRDETSYYESYNNYQTPYEDEQPNFGSEPFDNYEVPGNRYETSNHINGDSYSSYVKLNANSNEESSKVIGQRPSAGLHISQESFQRSPERNEPTVLKDNTNSQSYPYQPVYDSQNDVNLKGARTLNGYNEDFIPQDSYVVNENIGPIAQESGEKKKKKKKKKKSKMNDFDQMMANLPDGPPPPLSSTEPTQNYQYLDQAEHYSSAEAVYNEHDHAYLKHSAQESQAVHNTRQNTGYDGSIEPENGSGLQQNYITYGSATNSKNLSPHSGSGVPHLDNGIPEVEIRNALPTAQHHHLPHPQTTNMTNHTPAREQQGSPNEYGQSMPHLQSLQRSPNERPNDIRSSSSQAAQTHPQQSNHTFQPQFQTNNTLSVPVAQHHERNGQHHTSNRMMNVSPQPNVPHVNGAPYHGAPMPVPAVYSPNPASYSARNQSFTQSSQQQHTAVMQPAPSMPPSMNGQPMYPQYYYPPPPQGFYGPPQAYGYQQPMYYPPPGRQYMQPQPQAPKKPTTSEITMMSMPTHNAFKKNAKPNKVNMRAALNQGAFGI